jgi:glucosamine-6-phosphate deaminase
MIGKREDKMSEFHFKPSKWAPFADPEVCDRVRQIRKEELAKHSNPDLKITIVRDADFSFLRVQNIFLRIKQASEEGKRLVLILPQQDPMLARVAYLINKHRVDCRMLYTFNMDEWADEDGHIAPETYPFGFLYAMKRNFYRRLDPKLRPPEEHIQGPTDKNIKDYGKMMEDLGGVDVCYGGIGWSGHIAFIDPDTEFKAPLEEFVRMGPRVVTLNPITMCQSSIMDDVGAGGDWAAVPPKAATIGPAQVIGARLRCSWNAFTIPWMPMGMAGGHAVSWQRFTVRLALHGRVTPQVPASILQLGKSEVYVAESVAEDLVPVRNWLIEDAYYDEPHQ